MPELASLQIQLEETGPVRIVVLPRVSVRIGRAAYCDVRVPGVDVADEACRLRRQGNGWQLVPIGKKRGSVSMDGRIVDEPTPIEFGMSFHVGKALLTLQSASRSSLIRGDAAGVETWGGVESQRRGARAESELASVHRADWQQRSSEQDRWLQVHREAKRWESRFRAAATLLRARSDASPPAPARLSQPTAPISRETPGNRTSGISLNQVRTARTPAPRDSRFTSLAAAPSPPSTPDALPEPFGWDEKSDSSAMSLGRWPVRALALRREFQPFVPAIEEEKSTELVTLEHALDNPAPLIASTRLFEEPLDNAWLAAALAELMAIRSQQTTGHDKCLCETDQTEPEVGEVISEQAIPPDSLGKLECFLNAELEIDQKNQDESSERASFQLGAVSRGEIQGVRQTPSALTMEPWEDPIEDLIVEGELVVASDSGLLFTQRAKLREREDETFAEEVEFETTVFHEFDPQWTCPTRFFTDPRSVEPLSDANPSFNSARADRLGQDWRAQAPVREARAANDSVSSRDWPSVTDIFASRVSRRAAAVESPTNLKSKVISYNNMPTFAKEPSSWVLPLWLGWIPLTLAATGLGVVGMAAAWSWTLDGWNVGVVASRLASVELIDKPLPEGVAPPESAWWKTTASHLVTWAAYRDRTARDAGDINEACSLLNSAAHASPLNPTVRYALAHPMPGESTDSTTRLARSLGQSRDVISMSWAGRQLLVAGRKEAAMEAYRVALAMAARHGFERSEQSVFLEDPDVRRYALPSEKLLSTVISDMAGSPAWSYAEWSRALPERTMAKLVAARLLREMGSVDADAALDASLSEAESITNEKFHPATESEAARRALQLASGAAALGMKHRFSEARDGYMQAIELMPVDAIKRAWWLNVAYLEGKLDNERARSQALEGAKNSDTKDEITMRAVRIQKETGVVVHSTASPVRPRR